MEKFEQKKNPGRSDALLPSIKWPRIPAQYLENAPELLFHEAAVSGEQAPFYVTLDGDLDVTKG